MNESKNYISNKSGLPPGSLVHIGNRKEGPIRISVIDYDSNVFSELECTSIEDCYPYRDSKTLSWINVDGLHDIDIISKIGQQFELHPLLLEDVLNTRHRPKMEEFDKHLFLTFKMLGISKNGKSIASEQVSLVLGENWLLSFQEQEGDIFNNLRSRIREGKGIIREKGLDYLLYRILDTVVDNYFFVTEYFGENIEKLEEQILQDPTQQSLQRIQELKKLLVNFRKSIFPLREAISSLQKDNKGLITEGTLRYLKDVYEHLFHLSDSIENQRDILGSVMELYTSGVSNKMNKVMQVLTVVSTIFIPLTFIAGIYGMNFDHMPELHWKYGYYGTWGVMLIVIATMFRFFKKRGWI